MPPSAQAGSVAKRVARIVATVGGAGYAPRAPGTVGTIAAIPLAVVTASLPTPAFVALCAGIIALAIWASAVADATWETRDSKRIVIDEVAGYMVAVALVDRADPATLLAAFVLFRAFDIFKPPPIGWIDREFGREFGREPGGRTAGAPKAGRGHALRGGASVVLDDVVAGIYTALILLALTGLGLLPR